MNGIRVLVCGGRSFADKVKVWTTLSQIHARDGITCLIHGAAPGADTLAEEWAAERHVSRHRFPAQWEKHGKAAGPIRNQAMIDRGRPDLVVAFPGGAGTADMVRRAKADDIKILEISA